MTNKILIIILCTVCPFATFTMNSYKKKRTPISIGIPLNNSRSYSSSLVAQPTSTYSKATHTTSSKINVPSSCTRSGKYEKGIKRSK